MTSKSDVKDEVREFTGYTSNMVLSEDGLNTAYRRAKQHIRVEKGLAADFVWFSEEKPEVEQALFWWTCLFCKVSTGELDSQDLQAGAVNQSALLAKDDNSVTEWYRQAHSSLEAMTPSSIIRSSSPSRTDREYTLPGFSTGDNSGGSTASSDDIEL